MNPKIGTRNSDGSINLYPEQDVNGNPSSRPAAITIELDADHFCVAPPVYDPAAVDALRDHLKPVRKSKPVEGDG